MSSPKQIEANRLNAKKSTGPRTPAGKAKSKFNALKAGIDAGAEAIPGEDPDQLRALRDDYYDRFTPDRPEEYALVDSLIASDWLLRRLRGIEGQVWKHGVAKAREWSSFKPATPLASALPSVEDSLTRLQRRMDAADRAYHRALNQIRRLQQAPLEPFASEPLPGEREVAQAVSPAGGLDAAPPAPAAQPNSNQQHSPVIGFVPASSASRLGWGQPFGAAAALCGGVPRIPAALPRRQP
jgi:hypothetical protein